MKYLTTVALLLFMGCALSPKPQTISVPNNARLLSLTILPLQWAEPDAETGVMGEVRTRCTAFSVAPLQGGWITAAHCVVNFDGVQHSDAFQLAGQPVHVYDVDREIDLALLVADGWTIPDGLRLATEAPIPGDRAETMGFAYGLQKPLYFVGPVSQTSIMTPWGPYFGTIMAIPVFGGQSGSPIVNTMGDVIGVALRAFGGTQFTGVDPYLGSLTYEQLVAFDRGWVFGD